jgi:hypothetical protein
VTNTKLLFLYICGTGALGMSMFCIFSSGYYLQLKEKLSCMPIEQDAPLWWALTIHILDETEKNLIGKTL